MKFKLFIIISISLFTTCTTVEVTKLSQDDLLNISYEDESEELLQFFFDRWQNDIKPNNLDEIESDTVKTVYEVFASIYNPPDKFFYASNEQNDKYERKYPDFSDLFVIIQKQLQYIIVDSLYSSGDVSNFDSLKEYYEKNRIIIENFKPSVKFSAKVVYLNSDYEKIFKKFFNVTDYKEQERRKNFVRNVGNVPGAISVSTYPFVSMIELNSNLNRASVSLLFQASGSKAYLEKEGNEWKIEDIKLMWIE